MEVKSWSQKTKTLSKELIKGHTLCRLTVWKWKKLLKKIVDKRKL